MSRAITIVLPDAVEKHLADVARERGLSVEEAALAELGRGASRRSAKMLSDPGQLERAVMEGLEGPGWTPTAEEWQKKADDVIARHRRSNVG